MFFPRQCGELGSQKAAAILGRLRVCRTRMELSPMLRAAHHALSVAGPHLYPAFSEAAQACLAFANPPPAVAQSYGGQAGGNRIRHTVASRCAATAPNAIKTSTDIHVYPC